MKNLEWLKLWADGVPLEYKEDVLRDQDWRKLVEAGNCLSVPGPWFSDTYVFRKAGPKQYLYVLKNKEASETNVLAFLSPDSPEVRKNWPYVDETDYLIFGQELKG